MPRRVILEEVGAADQAARLSSTPARRVDLQDVLLLVGIGLWEIGAAVVWWPASLILGGLFCFGFAFLIGRSKGNQRGNPKP